MERTGWFTEAGDDLLFERYLRRVDDYREHMAKGEVSVDAAQAQAERVVGLLRALEERLDDDTHALLTEALLEWALLQGMQLTLALEAA